MKLHRSLFSIALLMALLGGSVTASAQAVPTPTPAPAVCNPPGFGPNDPACRNGAAPPGFPFGVSGSNFNSVDSTSCCTGTFGAAVHDSNGNEFILSNNHVLARTSSTKKKAALKEPIVQPGLVDLGCFQDKCDEVATLSKFVPLDFNHKDFNTVDAAIAKVLKNARPIPECPKVVNGMDANGTIWNLASDSAFTFPSADGAMLAGQISTTPISDPINQLQDGMPIQKMGRTTCLTIGQIDALDATGKVAYDKGCNSADSGTATFSHQVLVIGSPFTAPPDQDTDVACIIAKPGDSGSLIVTGTPETIESDGFRSPGSACPQAIGLLFAATPDGHIAIANPIQRVLNAFSTATNKLTLVGDSQCTPAISGAASAHNALFAAATPSAALRSSRAQVRAVKERHAASLLKLDEVVAVGIGAGADSDHAALNVYLKNDTPQVRAKIPSQIDGVPVKIRHSAEFHAL